MWRILQLLLPKLCYCLSPKIVRFQNGSNKVAIELRVVQFCSKGHVTRSNFSCTLQRNGDEKKPFKLQRGCHTFPTFSQLATRTITNKMAETLNEQKMSSDWPILTKLRFKLLRGCYTQATCLATLRKGEGRSTFLAARNATSAVAKWGVTSEFFLATCNATFVALQVARKIASCNMAFSVLVSRSRGFLGKTLLSTLVSLSERNAGSRPETSSIVCIKENTKMANL